MIVIHEAGRECVWLILIIQHIQKTGGLPSKIKIQKTLYEDNVACITRLKKDTSKKTEWNIFHQKKFTHDFQTKCEKEFSINSFNDNLADMFNKT